MDNKNLGNAFKEVYEILKVTDKKIYNKIPDQVITYIISNMNEDHQIDIGRKNLKDIDMLEETEIILATMYDIYNIRGIEE